MNATSSNEDNVPVSPAPVGDMDAAIEAAARALFQPLDPEDAARWPGPKPYQVAATRAAITAALPHLSPRPAPVADREELAALLAEHRMVPLTVGWTPGNGNPLANGYGCSCGVRTRPQRTEEGLPIDGAWYDAHMIDVLMAAGYRKGGHS